MIINKYDKYLASDPYPVVVKYVSFASFNNTPIEYFYNCSLLNSVNIQSSKAEKLIAFTSLNESISNSPQEPKITPYIQTFNLLEFSAIEFALLVMVTVIFTLNIVILYYVFILVKYIE